MKKRYYKEQNREYGRNAIEISLIRRKKKGKKHIEHITKNFF